MGIVKTILIVFVVIQLLDAIVSIIGCKLCWKEMLDIDMEKGKKKKSWQIKRIWKR